MIRAVLFDLYDTLLHTTGSGTREKAIELARGAGIQPQDWLRGWRAGLGPSLRGALPTLLDRVRAALAEAGYKQPCSELADELAGLLLTRDVPRVYPDVQGALTDLRRRGYSLALVSNIESHQKHWVIQLGLSSFFDAVSLSCELGVCKPEPGIYLAAAEALATEPSACVFVGDGASRELSGARALGMTAVRIERSERDEHEERDDTCDARVTTLSQFLEWLTARQDASHRGERR